MFDPNELDDNYDDLDGMCGLSADQWRSISADDDPENTCVAFATQKLFDEFVETENDDTA